MQIITVAICAVILLGMAKKTTNNWRQLSLLSSGSEAVRLQRPGESIQPSEMYFGSAICMSSMFDLSRMLIRDSENGWFKDDTDILVMYELGRGDQKRSPYFVIEKGESDE